MSVYTGSSGSNAVTSGWDGNGAVWSTLSTVGGNATLDGNHPIHIVGLSGYAAGHGASSTITLSYAGSNASAISMASGSAAVSTGYRSASIYLTGATSSTYKISGSTAFYFGRSSTSGSLGVQDGVGSGFTGTLGMSYEYYQGPTAPLSPSLMRGTSTTATLTWTAPSSTGGEALTGYNIQAALDSGFTSGVLNFTAAGTDTSATLTGLSSNAKYYVRMNATNEVTDHYSTSSVWSAVVSLPQVITFPKVWNGSAWVRPVQWIVWNGTAWVQPQSIQIWDGTNWDPAV